VLGEGRIWRGDQLGNERWILVSGNRSGTTGRRARRDRARLRPALKPPFERAMADLKRLYDGTARHTTVKRIEDTVAKIE
jgi:hypothetical protein